MLWAYLQVVDRLVPFGSAAVGPICARRLERWDELHKRRPAIELVRSPEEVFTSDVDVVVIITPPEEHYSLARKALEAGKHVLVEKPLARNRAEAETLAAIADVKRLHLVAAPFVQQAPTFRLLWTKVKEGVLGHVHSARGLYGNAGSTWASWYHESDLSPLAELGIYNLKSLTALLGPVKEVVSLESTAVRQRVIGDLKIEKPDSDVSHVLLRHVDGAISSIVSSHAVQRYRRPGLELYGTEGTANLLGDDWDPRGIEIWQNAEGCWRDYEPIEPTWLWADGISDLVACLRENRKPCADLAHDLHLLDIIEAAKVSTKRGMPALVHSTFPDLDLRMSEPEKVRHHVHDHTRPSDLQ